MTPSGSPGDTGNDARPEETTDDGQPCGSAASCGGACCAYCDDHGCCDSGDGTHCREQNPDATPCTELGAPPGARCNSHGDDDDSANLPQCGVTTDNRVPFPTDAAGSPFADCLCGTTSP